MDKLYSLMNWRNIEGVVYSDIGNPKSVLGLKDEKYGSRIGVFAPDAKNVSIKVEGIDELYSTEKMDESGYYE